MYATDRSDLNPELNQNRIGLFSSPTQLIQQVSSESVHHSLRYPAGKRADQQAGGEPITSGHQVHCPYHVPVIACGMTCKCRTNRILGRFNSIIFTCIVMFALLTFDCHLRCMYEYVIRASSLACWDTWTGFIQGIQRMKKKKTPAGVVQCLKENRESLSPSGGTCTQAPDHSGV